MKNILLIGMPGSGKSTIGEKLSHKYGFGFIDTDKFIEESEKSPLQLIINSVGIENARKLEDKYLKKINVEKQVIATGGSAVYYAEAMQHLKKNSITIFLDVDLKELCKRVKNFQTRGIIMTPEQTFKDIFNERYQLYKKYADFTIKNQNKKLDDIVEKIISIYKKNAPQ